MKKVAILQSNYIPWKGYFDIIAAVDEFIIYDEMQYTRSDWRNRNQIKTPQGVQWLTIPVQITGRFPQRILDAEIKGTHWAATHWKTLAQNYRRCPHYQEIADWLEPLYLAKTHTNLSALNRELLQAVCDYLGIATRITASTDYVLGEGKTERLINLCQQAGAREYVSGPAAREYLDESLFRQHAITLTWFDYSGYPEYPQPWGEFTHGVTILDLLFNCGKEAGSYMKYAAHAEATPS
ncbi:WbqC family protein [Bordetella genomosp. 13]|uniref:WbqC family protein n=1 Tax=Bordetella genomosp. 13 TaxID=463040 RepID=UPI0011A4ECCA|nr:WbqC family protein [Bordetella genomosp. 13]